MSGTNTKKPKFLVFGIPKLVNYLRTLGFDTTYLRKDYNKAIQIAKKEERILISQINNLPKLPWVLYLSEKKNDLRLKEIFQKLHLSITEEDIYTRCGACNTLLEDIPREKLEEILPSDLKKCNYLFKRCPNCGKIYWKGEHYLTLKNKLLKLGIMREEGYYLFDHTADLGIEIYSKSPNGVFELLGKALFSEIIEGEIRVEKSYDVKISGNSKEELLVKFVNELLYLFEVKELIFSEFSCELREDILFCRCYGERFDPNRHIQKREIKAATYHKIFFGKKGEMWNAKIIFDI